MSDLVQVLYGMLALVVLVAVVLALAFAIPALIHLLIELPQRGWEAGGG